MEIEICGQKYAEADVPLEMAKDALCVQNACNLGGVSGTLAQHVKALHRQPSYKGTDWIRHHPIMVMFLNQMVFLSTGDSIDLKAYIAANDLCKAVVESHEREFHARDITVEA